MIGDWLTVRNTGYARITRAERGTDVYVQNTSRPKTTLENINNQPPMSNLFDVKMVLDRVSYSLHLPI